ncbi:MFS transporter [Larsenimonas rhizosphaerae]|uniref:MFS transporter n=1 Tax=Larsenimonas rhizosphaerae TaxID=2944682 RepID=A0AA41ZF81_9GAMM|nr:MFS transporter [Larsenimonas rhizosphaerae]MCX2524139.1 MFS transporter [Larsenimonas rhizosphaerae]
MTHTPSPRALPYTVWWLTLCQALLVSGNIVLITITPLIGQQIAPSDGLATLPVAIQMLGLTAAALPAGWLTARFGRRRTFVIGNLTGMAGIGLCALSVTAHHFVGFNAGTFLIGTSIGTGMLYRFAAVDAAPLPQRDRALSMVMAGGVLAAFFGPWLAVHTQGVSETPFLGSLAGLAGLYLVALLIIARVPLINPVKPGSLRQGRSWRVLLGQPVLASAIVAGLLGYSLMTLIMTATPLAMTHASMNIEHVANVIRWHVLAMFAPSFITGRLIQQCGHTTMILLGSLLLALALLCAWWAPASWAFYTGLILLGLGWNFTFVTASAWLTTTYRPEEAPRVQALNDCLVFGGSTLASLLAGPLSAELGWQWLNMGVLPVCVILILVVARTAWQQRTRSDQAPLDTGPH